MAGQKHRPINSTCGQSRFCVVHAAAMPPIYLYMPHLHLQHTHRARPDQRNVINKRKTTKTVLFGMEKVLALLSMAGTRTATAIEQIQFSRSHNRIMRTPGPNLIQCNIRTAFCSRILPFNPLESCTNVRCTCIVIKYPAHGSFDFVEDPTTPFNFLRHNFILSNEIYWNENPRPFREITKRFPFHNTWKWISCANEM